MVKRKSKSRPGAGMAGSVNALAKAIGVSPTAARGWIADRRWPFGKLPPWNPERVQEWRARTLRPDPAANPGLHTIASDDTPGLQKSKLLLNLERAQSIRQRREIEAGKFVALEEIERRDVAKVHAIKWGLFALARNAAAELAGRTADEVTEILHRRFALLCNDFAGER